MPLSFPNGHCGNAQCGSCNHEFGSPVRVTPGPTSYLDLTFDPQPVPTVEPPVASTASPVAPTPDFQSVGTYYCRRCDRYAALNRSELCSQCAPLEAELREQMEREREERRRFLDEERARIAHEYEQRRIEREREARRRQREARATLKTRGRRFGVELEVTFDEDDMPDSSDIAAMLSDAGIPCVDPGYTHDVEEGVWKVVSDGSVYSGWEVVSPPLYWDQREQVQKVCEVLQSMGAHADRSTGLHVHHEVADLSLSAFKRLVNRWVNVQPVIDNIVDDRRRSYGCEWARALSAGEVREVTRLTSLRDMESCYLDRYRSLNLTAFGKYGTVEIRQYQGTVDADEILAWVALGQAIITDAKRARTFDRGTAACRTAAAFIGRLPFHCEDARDTMLSYAARPVAFTTR